MAAARFAAEGARVVGCDLDGSSAAATEAAVRSAGGEITVMGGVDLGDADAARGWVDAAVATYDGIDVLYNNASTQRFGALDELTVDEWDFTMRNELDLVYYTVRAAWPHLKATGGGSILNVGSIAAIRGVEFMPQNAHSTAKGGVIALTLQLVVEGGPHGIRANVISPGLIETPNTAPMLASPPRAAAEGRPRPDPAGPARPARGHRQRRDLPVLRRGRRGSAARTWSSTAAGRSWAEPYRRREAA